MNIKNMLPLIKDSDGLILFFIEVSGDTEYKMQFKVYEVGGWLSDGENTPIDLELYVHGVVKWDGCSHIYFGDDFGNPDGYLHLYGKSCYERHVSVMLELYNFASKTIEKFDKSVAK